VGEVVDDNDLYLFSASRTESGRALQPLESIEDPNQRPVVHGCPRVLPRELDRRILYICERLHLEGLPPVIGSLDPCPDHLPFYENEDDLAADLSIRECVRIYLLLRFGNWKQRPLATKLRFSEEFRRQLGISKAVSQPTISRMVSRMNEKYPKYASKIENVRRDLLLTAQDTEYADWFAEPPGVEFDGGIPDVKIISRKLRRLVYPFIKLNREGNSQYEKDSLLKILACAGRWGCQPNQAAKAMELKPWNHNRDVPDASSLFYNIWPLSSEQVMEMFIVAHEALHHLARGYTSFGGAEVAIDLTDVQTFGDPDASTGISGTKPGRNFAYAWQYATLGVVGDHPPLTLAALPTEKRSNLNIAVKRLLTYATAKYDVERVYLDSGFYTTSVRKVLDDLDVDFVMKAKQKAAAIDEMKDAAISMDDDYRAREWGVGDWPSNDYLWVAPSRKRSSRRKSDPDHPRDDWETFYSNLSPDEHGAAQLAADYRKRWGEETKYRVLKHRFLPQCNSTEKHVRAFVVNYAALLYNMWQLSNLIAADWDNSVDLDETYKYEANYFSGAIVDDSRTIDVGEVGDLSNHSEILNESSWF
jgi:hypothetical protein